MRPLAVLYDTFEINRNTPFLLTVAGGLSGEMQPFHEEKAFMRIINSTPPYFAVFHLHEDNLNSCFKLMHWLREFHPGIPALVVSTRRELLYKCICLGARSFINGWDLNRLVSAMAEVHARGTALPQDLANALSHQVQTFVTVSSPHNLWATLTRREKSILHLKKRNFSHENIAAELEISGKTLQNHISQILKKLKSKSLKRACAGLPAHYFEQEGFEIV